jgi:hypothetical protein
VGHGDWGDVAHCHFGSTAGAAHELRKGAEPYWSLVTAILASCHIQNTTFHGRPIPMNDQLIISTPHAWAAPAFASCIGYLLSLLRLHVALVTCCQAATVAVHFVVLE